MNRFQACTVISAAHSSVLEYRSDSETEHTDSYDELKEDITKWMKFVLGEESNLVNIFDNLNFAIDLRNKNPSSLVLTIIIFHSRNRWSR